MALMERAAAGSHSRTRIPGILRTPRVPGPAARGPGPLDSDGTQRRLTAKSYDHIGTGPHCNTTLGPGQRRRRPQSRGPAPVIKIFYGLLLGTKLAKAGTQPSNYSRGMEP